MDTLDGTDWDVVISGTGLPQSLLALSLSRSGKRILHLDHNDYYGGDEVALSLAEAEVWAERYAGRGEQNRSRFSHASIEKPAASDEGVKLSQPRAYSLALAPQVIHTQSKLLPALVSSRIHNQLDFQAVGSWFLLESSDNQQHIVRVPSGREDIFQDSAIDLKAKRSLMKFLRFVGTFEEQRETWETNAETPFPDFLQQKFGLPPTAHAPLLALTLAPGAAKETSTAFALPRIARHLRSIGMFGPGFGAVLPKWGGLAEIAQVACRAGAVGGGVYVLKKGIESGNVAEDGKLSLKLSDGETVTTAWLTGSSSDLPDGLPSASVSSDPGRVGLTRGISVVSSPLSALFPPTAEGGVSPAGAVVVVPSTDGQEPPVHILAHTSDAGECPSTQCVLYASVALPPEEGQQRLRSAVDSLLAGLVLEQKPRLLWSMQYHQRGQAVRTGESNSNIICLPSLSSDLALDDQELEDVKKAWLKITGENEEMFLKFDAREGTEDED